MICFLPKCTVLKADLLQNHQVYCLQACMCAIFSPEILQALAVKGLKHIMSVALSLHQHLASRSGR